jgi:hypothetical protein
MATAAPVQPAAPRRGIKALLIRHPLVFFFLLAFLFSWVWWGLCKALQLPEPLVVVGAAGPTGSAFVVLAITSGKPAVLDLLRSYVHWRVGVQWYLVALIGVPVLMLLAYAVLPGALADFVAPDWSFVPFYLSQFAITLFIPPRGPLLEEGGWRGLRYPVCNGYTGLWWEHSSSGRSGPCGTGPSTLGRCRSPDPMLPSSAPALLSSSTQSAQQALRLSCFGLQ